jgi:hypothetical protein
MADDQVSGTEGASQDSAPIVDTQSSSNTDAVAATPETPVAPAEKMIPQSQVNKIAAREAHQAAERARRETVAEFQRQQPQADTQNAQQQSIGGMQQHDPD